jgi:hypothetical protein
MAARTRENEKSIDDAGDALRQPLLAIVAVGLLAWGAVLLVFLFWVWRTTEDAAGAVRDAGNPVPIDVTLLGWTFSVTAETALLMLVMATAAVGSYVHAATSFVSYVGNQRLHRSWVAWYLFRSLIGASLAVVFYVVVRAGFLSGNTGAEEVNIFGIAALAGLTGMFSKQATDKLREVFDTLFTSRGDDDRADKLEPLKLDVIIPSVVDAGGGPQSVILQGSGFGPDTAVVVDGQQRVPTRATATEITIELTPEDIAAPRVIPIYLKNAAGNATAVREVSVQLPRT